MNWDKPFSAVEFTFIGIFLLIYVLYIARTLWIANKLSTSARPVALKFFLRTIYFGLLIVGLLKPSFGKTELEAQAAGKDIYIAIDLSKSMDAIDVVPSRLEKLKFELLQSINQLKANRLGLIIFSSEAYVYSPLTFDQDALKLFIQRLNTNLISEGGTNINSVFELVNEKFITNKSSESRAKALCLITDGEDFGEIDQRLITSLTKNEISLLVLGVGTLEGGKIRQGANGTKFKKDKNGQEIVSRLNTNFLRKLVSQSNGKYFELSNNTNQVETMIKATENIENRQKNARRVTVASNKYAYFLIVALLLICLDVMVTVRTIKL